MPPVTVQVRASGEEATSGPPLPASVVPTASQPAVPCATAGQLAAAGPGQRRGPGKRRAGEGGTAVGRGPERRAAVHAARRHLGGAGGADRGEDHPRGPGGAGEARPGQPRGRESGGERGRRRRAAASPAGHHDDGDANGDGGQDRHREAHQPVPLAHDGEDPAARGAHWRPWCLLRLRHAGAGAAGHGRMRAAGRLRDAGRAAPRTRSLEPRLCSFTPSVARCPAKGGETRSAAARDRILAGQKRRNFPTSGRQSQQLLRQSFDYRHNPEMSPPADRAALRCGGAYAARGVSPLTLADRERNACRVQRAGGVIHATRAAEPWGHHPRPLSTQPGGNLRRGSQLSHLYLSEEGDVRRVF